MEQREKEYNEKFINALRVSFKRLPTDIFNKVVNIEDYRKLPNERKYGNSM